MRARYCVAVLLTAEIAEDAEMNEVVSLLSTLCDLCALRGEPTKDLDMLIHVALHHSAEE